MDLLYRFARSVLLFHELAGGAHHEALGAGGLKFHLEQRIAAHRLDLRDDTGAKRAVRDPVANGEGRSRLGRRLCRGRRGTHRWLTPRLRRRDRIGTRRALARRVLLLVAAGLGIAVAARDVAFLNIFLRDFSVILEALKSDDAFMETKYATQSAQVYYRVEKNVFEDYVKRLSELEIQEFIDYCKQLGFIRVEGNKCLFSSGKARAYFLSKKIIDNLSI